MAPYFRLGALLVLLVFCLCEEEEDAWRSEGAEEEKVVEEKVEDEGPEYEVPTPKDVFYYETFSSSLEDLSWTLSEHNEGEVKIGRGSQASGIKSEQGLILQEEAKRYSISSKFPSNFDPKDQDLVLQYEVRFHNNHQCGGAYLKLIKADQDFETKTFKESTEYIVMFGPDKCGQNDKVHFIFRHQHKKTLEFEEKHLKDPPAIINDRLTHLYTLVIRTDNTYEIFIDQESKASGKLLEDFEPAVNPPKEIADPDDHKPEDWVDEAKIPDPDASKPDDWDENAPKEIVDEDATMPSGWNVDEPFQIPDPQAEQPEDWDEEDDGEWEAPLIENPACSVGCGTWEPPLIPNPDYKGKWIHPKIDNPDYKGEWSPKQISNPDYFEDPEPHQLHPMTAVGFEIWTMQKEIEFDNVFIDSSLERAKEFAKATWAKKYQVQKSAQDKADGSMSAISGLMGPLNSFMDYCTENPAIGIVLCCVIVLVISVGIYFIVGLCCPGDTTEFPSTDSAKPRHEDEEKKSSKEEKDEDEDEGEEEEEKEQETEGNEPDNKCNENEQEEGVDKVKEKQELEEEKKTKN